MQPSITTRHARLNPWHGLIAAAIIGMFVLGMVLGALPRDAKTSSTVGNAAQPAPVAQVAAQPETGSAASIAQRHLIDLNTIYTPGYVATPARQTVTGDRTRFLEENLYLPEGTANPARDFSRDWQRFRSVNGADGIETGSVVSGAQQRFIEQNIYLPESTVNAPSAALAS